MADNEDISWNSPPEDITWSSEAPKPQTFREREHAARAQIHGGDPALSAEASATGPDLSSTRRTAGENIRAHGRVAYGVPKGFLASIAGGAVGDTEGLGRRVLKEAGVGQDTTIPTTSEGGYLGPKGLGIMGPAASPEEEAGMAIGALPAQFLLGKAASPVARYVGNKIKPLAGPEVPPEVMPPAMDRVNTMTGRTTEELPPLPREEPPAPPPLDTPEGATSALGKLADVVEAEPRAVPRPDAETSLLPPQTPHEMRSPRSSAGAAGNPDAGPLADVLPETREQLARIYGPEFLNEGMVEEALSNQSAHHTLAEISPNTVNETKIIQSLGGQARNVISNFFRGRAGETGARARAMLDRAMGTPEDLHLLDQADRRARAAASGPLYRKFESTQIPPTPEIDAVMNRIPRSVAAEAEEFLHMQGVPSSNVFEANQGAGTVSTPTARAFQLIKESLDDQITKSIRAGAGKRAAMLTGLKNDLVRSIDNHPDPAVRGVWAAAREAYAIPSEIIEARNAGYEAFKSGTSSSALREIYDAYSPEAKASFRQGMRAHFEDLLEGKGSETRVNANVRNEALAPRNLRKLAEVLGEDEASLIGEGFGHETTMAGNHHEVMHRSPSADIHAGQEAWLPKEGVADKVQRAADFAHAPLQNTVKGVGDYITKAEAAKKAARAERVREEVANIVTLQGAQKEEAAWAIYRLLHPDAAVPPPTGTPLRITVNPRQRADGGRVGFDKILKTVRGFADGGMPEADDAAAAQDARDAAAARLARGAVSPEGKPSEGPGYAATEAFIPALAKNVGRLVTYPARLAASGAYQPGQSVADTEMKAQERGLESPIDWAGETALNTFGTSAPFAEAGALGSAGGKLAAAAPRAERELSPLGLYSHAEEAAAALPQERGTGQQFRAMLDKAGVKPDEFEHTGLGEFLASRGDAPVTRSEIAEHLKNNRVQIGEKVKGLDTRDYFENLNRDEQRRIVSDWEDEVRPTMSEAQFEEDYGNTRWRRHAAEQWHDNKVGDVRDATKYEGYQLPGGENYQERLLTLPDKFPQQMSDARGAMTQKLREKYGDNFADNWTYAEKYAWMKTPKSQAYISPHWDEPNVLAHVRTNDRTIDGKKSLHLEELQSDWHQVGRKEGYQGELKPETKRLMEERDRLADEVADIQHNNPDYFDNQNYINKMDRITEINKQIDQPYGQAKGVPNAPFKTTWHELALKRMLRHAAENGYDRLSWTPGEAQAARYDLSKSVDRIEYNPKTNHLVAYEKGRGGSKDVPFIDQTVKPGDLPNAVGKEAAERVLEQKPDVEGYHLLSGDDLKIGGEGMKGFYDQIVPKAIEKIGKAHGVKVKQGNAGEHQVHYIDISPEFRAALMKGQKLFASGGAVKPSSSPISKSPALMRTLSAIKRG